MKHASQSYRPSMESLEDRLTPAFSFSAVGGDVILTQTSSAGDATVSFDGTDLILTEAATVNYGNVLAGSLTVNMLSGSGDSLTLTLDGPVIGNLTINLGNGDRTVTLDGMINEAFGNTRITGGTGVQTVNLADGLAGFSTGGSLYIDLGYSADVLTATAGLSAGSNITLYRVNTFDDGTSFGSIGGSVTFNDGYENQANTLTLDSGGFIGNRLTYYGGNGTDSVTLDGVVGGAAYLRMGNGDNSFTLTGASTIASTFTYYGGSGTDTVDYDDAGNVIGSSININAGFLGDNVINLDGFTGARSVSIYTGMGNDDVTYNMGGFAYLRAILNLGNDTFDFGPSGSLYYLYVDFGFGMDSFIPGGSAFRVYLRNLP